MRLDLWLGNADESSIVFLFGILFSLEILWRIRMLELLSAFMHDLDPDLPDGPKYKSRAVILVILPLTELDISDDKLTGSSRVGSL